MKIISEGYKYFGRQCKHCGAYFTYEPIDAVLGQCPNCYAPFTHSVDDKEVDIEPDAATLKLQQKLRGKAKTTVFMPEFNVGQEVHVIYDSYYSLTGSKQHIWLYGDTAVISEILCSATPKGIEYNYILDRAIITGKGGQTIRDTASGAIDIKALPEHFKYDDRLGPDQKAVLPLPPDPEPEEEGEDEEYEDE